MASRKQREEVEDDFKKNAGAGRRTGDRTVAAHAHRYPKQVREKRMAAMKKHRNAIIQDWKRLASDYGAMAKWHRIAATHLDDGEE